MSETEQKEWTLRWSEDTYDADAKPSSLVSAWATRVPHGRAVDLACGDGHNALYLAELGFLVDALDIAPTALNLVIRAATERGLSINTIVSDLDDYILPSNVYDLITIRFYTNRNMLTMVKNALKPNGFLIYEQHYVTHMEVSGPKSGDFRLLSNEMLELFSDFRIHYFSEGVEEEGGALRSLQRLVAQKMPGKYEPHLSL